MSKFYNLTNANNKQSLIVSLLEYEKYLYILFQEKINEKYIIVLSNSKDTFDYYIDYNEITLFPNKKDIYYYPIPLVDLIVSSEGYYNRWTLTIKKANKKNISKDIVIIKKNFYYNYLDYHKGCYVNLNL